METKKYEFRIKGLDCPNCALKVEEALKKEAFMKDVHLNFMDKKLSFKLEEVIEEPILINKINEIIDQIEPGVVIEPITREEQEVKKDKDYSLIIMLAITVISIILAKIFPHFEIAFMILAYVLVGFSVLKKSIINLFKGHLFDENFLMSLATLGAIYVGSYHEALAVMLFYQIGEFLQDRAIQASTNSIKSLVAIKSDEANVLVNGEIVVKKVEDVQIGDELVVKAGERIPLDGKIIDGIAHIDNAALTGESMPETKVIGNQVLAGGINLDKTFKMEVTKADQDSTVNKILNMVQEASAKKSASEKFITKFAKVYTPIVVLLAIIFLVVMVMLNGMGSFNLYLQRACTFLVISCPCALVVSIPLGIFAGVGKASKMGVLVKGGNYLELLPEVNNIVLDKTGTITKGQFEITDVSSPDVLKLAAYGEAYSNHPIAKVIIEKYGKSRLELDELKDYEEIAGEGIKVSYQGKDLLVGNYRLLKHFNIEAPEISEVGTVIYVSYNQKYQGYLIIRDQLKKDSFKAISELQKMHKNITILSGDNQKVVDQVKNELHLKNGYGDLLPQDKMQHLEAIIKKGKTMFIGDGINDAPSIMRADVGVAMGALGSDAAIEASDIVLMGDDLTSVVNTFKLANKTRKINYQNIAFAIGIKVLVLITSALGITSMWLGVFADVGVTLIAILNALRILK